MEPNTPQPERAGDVGSTRLVRLLDECATAMRAAKYEVLNRDLKIALEERSQRCREMIIELTQPNSELSSERAAEPQQQKEAGVTGRIKRDHPGSK